ncbi:unnamed protein product, partial [marine sediment metagenome]
VFFRFSADGVNSTDRDDYFIICGKQNLKKKIENKRKEFEKNWKIRFSIKSQRDSAKVKVSKVYEMIETEL